MKTFYIIVIIGCVVGWEINSLVWESKTDARLDKLEAASTVAQQPQERHVFDSLSGSTEWVLFSSDTSMHVRPDGKWMNVSFTYRSK